MKKVAALSMLALVAPILANASPAQIQQGPFAGVQATYLSTLYNFKDTKPAVGVTTQNPHANKLNYGIYGGYGSFYEDQNIYVGLRGGSTFGTVASEKVASSSYGDTKIKESQVYYADLLPGLLTLNRQQMVYFVLGAEHAKFRMSGLSGNHSDGEFGWRVGAGWAIAVSNHVSVDVEFVHTEFPEINFNKGAGNGHYRLDPRSNAVSLGLNYSFGSADNSQQLLS